MAQSGQRKCLCCKLLFDPDHQIVRWLDAHPYSAQQIYQRLCEAGYQGGRTIVKDYVHCIRRRRSQAFLKLDFAPAECAQVDCGEFGTIAAGTTHRRLSFFLMVPRLLDTYYGLC